MKNVLLLSGGLDHAHDFAASAAALVEVLAVDEWATTVVEHPDDVAGALPGSFDVVVVNALWWRMLHERYDPWRERFGYHTPDTTRRAIAGFVAGGGGLVGLHTASICFDDWPEWREILGGTWSWERSAHPPAARVSASVVDDEAGHPVLAGVGSGLDLVDEVYGDLDLAADVEVLMTARRNAGDVEQPVVWVHHYGAGRVVYDGFGHDAASLRAPRHAALVRRAVEWVTGGER